ncbi:HD-GYP domain-containing protein [Clostridium subterminale]|uniref:HD-GYP domain-containing protein n=1 Tax=Clostridium subterminale TaxID=1550 RepID=A0ABN1KQL3_CLOSU
MNSIPSKQKRFFILIYIVTIISFIVPIIEGQIKIQVSNYANIIVFIILTAITESFTVYFRNMSFSTSFAVTIASYILFGPFQCIIILVLGFLFRVMKIDNGKYKHIFNTPLYGTLFNCCALILPVVAGSFFYKLLGGQFSLSFIFSNIGPLIVFCFAFIIVNSLIMSILMSIVTNKNILFCFIGNIRMGILNSVVMIPIGILLALVFIKYGYLGIVFIAFPLLLIRYTLLLYTSSKSQFIDTVEALMNAIDARDQYTEGHSRRVAEISVAIAKELKYNQWNIEQLGIAAMLHDVGKIGVSDAILNKPGKLTDEEFDAIKGHPEIGIKIIKDIKNIDYVYPVVRNHHERYDGKGYPDGKKGDELPLNVYIVQLADTVDAMASDRPYRKGLSESVILEEINKYSGTQFHPKVAETYLRIVEKNDGKLP